MRPQPKVFELGGKTIKLFPSKSGQWRRDFWDKKKGRAIPKYFGSWALDPTGDDAMREYLRRHDAILSGTDSLATHDATTDLELIELQGLFLGYFRGRVAKGTASPETLGDYMRELPKFTAATGPTAKVNALKPDHFTRYADEELVKKRGLSPTAHRRIIAYIRAMFSWGAENGKCNVPSYGSGFALPDTSPEAVGLWKQRNGVEDRSERIATGGEITRMLGQSPPMFKAIILLMVNAGLGPADVGRLKWTHLKGKWMTMPRGKTGRKRLVYLWARTRKALERVKTLKHNKAAIAASGEEALVFVSRRGMAMYRTVEVFREGRMVGVKVQQSITTTVTRIAERAKAGGITPYRLRHTFATWAEEHSKSHLTVQVMMGHAARTVTDRYVHSPNRRAQVKRTSLGIKGELWPKRAETPAACRPT